MKLYVPKSPALKQKLESEAARLGMTEGSIISIALEMFLRDPEESISKYWATRVPTAKSAATTTKKVVPNFSAKRVKDDAPQRAGEPDEVYWDRMDHACSVNDYAPKDLF